MTAIAASPAHHQVKHRGGRGGTGGPPVFRRESGPSDIVILTEAKDLGPRTDFRAHQSLKSKDVDERPLAIFEAIRGRYPVVASLTDDEKPVLVQSADQLIPHSRKNDSEGEKFIELSKNDPGLQLRRKELT